MKKACFILVCFSIFSVIGLGQSVEIVSKKIVYTRPDPTSFLKETFSVNYPKIKSKTKLSKKIEDAISYRKVLSFEVKDELGEYQWLEEADYQIVYNQKGVLCIYLSMTGIGAYETTFGKYAVIDLKTGNRVTAKDVFINFNKLITTIRNLQKAEIAESTKEIKSQTDYGDVDTIELFKYTKFQKIHLEDFSIDKNGVTFHYSYGFPRILYPLEPAGNYFLSWQKIKPFIKRSGLLHKFIQ